MVIEKDGVKYACLPCIRGHRVKKCQHYDRQLAPLSKRGRQVSQCNHCRDLRSSGSHVKCTCASSSVLNRLNGCLCEISQTCTCVARHLQNIQTTPIDNDSVLLSASPYSHPSPAAANNTVSSVSNCHSTSVVSSLGGPSSFWLPSDLPTMSADSSHDLLRHVGHNPPNHASPSTNTNQLTPPSSSDLSLLHDMKNVAADSPSTITPSPEKDLIDIFLHKDIDDLLLL